MKKYFVLQFAWMKLARNGTAIFGVMTKVLCNFLSSCTFWDREEYVSVLTPYHVQNYFYMESMTQVVCQVLLLSKDARNLTYKEILSESVLDLAKNNLEHFKYSIPVTKSSQRAFWFTKLVLYNNLNFKMIKKSIMSSS